MSRRSRLLIATAAILAATALPAQAALLTIPSARERAAAYAERTCSHDDSCARSGVRACIRQTDHVVLCRIYDHRKTDQQGNFLCTRLVRLALEPTSNRVPVTGLSDWVC